MQKITKNTYEIELSEEQQILIVREISSELADTDFLGITGVLADAAMQQKDTCAEQIHKNPKAQNGWMPVRRKKHDNHCTTGGIYMQIVNATTEELVSELEKRNDNLYPLKEASEILALRDENNYVEGYIRIHINDMIDNDYEGFLDFISEKLVGSDLLMDVNYEVVAQAKKMFPNELILKVTGDASTIIESE